MYVLTIRVFIIKAVVEEVEFKIGSGLVDSCYENSAENRKHRSQAVRVMAPHESNGLSS